MTKLRTEVGNWYTDSDGQLMKLKMILYNQIQATSVLVEYLDGTQEVIGYEEWLEIAKTHPRGAS